MIPGNTFRIHNCDTATGGNIKFDLVRVDRGGIIASDPGLGSSCAAAGLGTNQNGAVITYTLDCATVPRFNQPDLQNPDYITGWYNLDQSCRDTRDTKCHGMAVLEILEGTACPYVDYPPPPPPEPFCGEYLAVNTAGATNLANSVPCPVPNVFSGGSVFGPTFAPGATYEFSFMCPSEGGALLQGVPWYQLLDSEGRDTGMEDPVNDMPCPGLGTYKKFTKQFDCVYGETWTLVRGCQGDEACLATPRITRTNAPSICPSPPPPLPSPPPPVPPAPPLPPAPPQLPGRRLLGV